MAEILTSANPSSAVLHIPQAAPHGNGVYRAGVEAQAAPDALFLVDNVALAFYPGDGAGGARRYAFAAAIAFYVDVHLGAELDEVNETVGRACVRGHYEIFARRVVEHGQAVSHDNGARGRGLDALGAGGAPHGAVLQHPVPAVVVDAREEYLVYARDEIDDGTGARIDAQAAPGARVRVDHCNPVRAYGNGVKRARYHAAPEAEATVPARFGPVLHDDCGMAVANAFVHESLRRFLCPSLAVHDGHEGIRHGDGDSQDVADRMGNGRTAGHAAGGQGLSFGNGPGKREARGLAACAAVDIGERAVDFFDVPACAHGEFPGLKAEPLGENKAE